MRFYRRTGVARRATNKALIACCLKLSNVAQTHEKELEWLYDEDRYTCLCIASQNAAWSSYWVWCWALCCWCEGHWVINSRSACFLTGSLSTWETVKPNPQGHCRLVLDYLFLPGFYVVSSGSSNTTALWLEPVHIWYPQLFWSHC